MKRLSRVWLAVMFSIALSHNGEVLPIGWRAAIVLAFVVSLIIHEELK